MEQKSTAVRPIDRILGLSGEEGVYGLAFDRAAGYLRDVLRKMSDHVGWKDTSRPFDFDGFSGYYPEIHNDHVDICEGDGIVATFTARPDGRLGFEAYSGEFSQYPDDVNPWYPLGDIMNGKLCLEPSNLEKAVEETHHGQMVIYGLRYGEDCAFACSPDDDRLRAALVEREPNIRFTDWEHFVNGVNAWMEKDATPGFEGPMRPEMVRYAWDGMTLRSEKEINLNQDRFLREAWGNDWDLIAELRRGGEDIRLELEKLAGIEGRKHFKFESALYPNLHMRDDALFLSSDCGRGMSDFITVSQGKVALYRDYDPDKALSTPRKVFNSVSEALSSVRSIVLGEKNVRKASMDYKAYKAKKGLSKGNGISI